MIQPFIVNCMDIFCELINRVDLNLKISLDTTVQWVFFSV